MPRRNNTRPHVPFSTQKGHDNKRRFVSKQEATEAIADSQRLKPDLVLSAYRCLMCHGWHLTSTGQNGIVK